MFTSPPRKGLNELVRRDPTRVGSWIAAILATQDTRILSQIRNLGLSLASAYAANDPEKAADLFRHLKDHTPPINVLIGDEKIPFHDYALFTATDAEPIAALRREAVEEVLDDAALQMLTTAAEVCGAAAWLGRYVEQLVASCHPAAQARALTLAGFRQPNDSSNRILSEDWGDGFLGRAASAAKKSYQRASWARHWLEQAAKTCDPIEFWRFGTLARGVVDVRFMRFLRQLPGTELFRSYGAELRGRLKTAAEDRVKKGRDTLFGHKAPRGDIALSLRDHS
jgi:hypothetical protein